MKLFFRIGLAEDASKIYKTLIIGINNSAVEIGRKLKKKKSDRRSVLGLIGFSNKDVGNIVDSFEVIGTDKNIVKIIKENTPPVNT